MSDADKITNEQLEVELEHLRKRVAALELALETVGGFVSWMMILKQLEAEVAQGAVDGKAEKLADLSLTDPQALHKVLTDSVVEAVAQFEGKPLSPAMMNEMTAAAVAAFYKSVEEL